MVVSDGDTGIDPLGSTMPTLVIVAVSASVEVQVKTASWPATIDVGSAAMFTVGG